VCDFNSEIAYYTRTQICEKPLYGISGGCPFVDNLALGVCGDLTSNAQRLALAERVTAVRCWPTTDKTAVVAIQFLYPSGSKDLGNEAVSGNSAPGSVTLDTSSSQVKRVQMWYSNYLDTGKRAQLGRLRITLTSNAAMDCGDTSLDMNAADLDNGVDPEDTGGLGSMLVGAVITSKSFGLTNKSVSINGFSLLLLRKPTKGVFTIEQPDFDPSTVAPIKVTDQSISTYSNAGNLGTMTVQCPAYEVSVETSHSFENSGAEVDTFEHAYGQDIGVEATTEVNLWAGESVRPLQPFLRTFSLTHHPSPITSQ
jgi:hypothetical protein